MVIARQWLDHERTDDEFRTQLDIATAAFVRSRDRLAALAAPSKFAPAKRLYVASASLYVARARVYGAAIGTPDPSQYDLLAKRLQELGDRVFDRGRAFLGITEGPVRQVAIHLPEEVPIWTAEGLAAGPPLDDPPPPRPAYPPLRADSRPQQPRSAWVRDVRKAAPPHPADLKTTDATRLRDLARRWVAAAEYLRNRPDPPTGREESARLRLSWLTYADAARAAQLGLADVSRQVAQAAAMIGP